MQGMNDRYVLGFPEMDVQHDYLYSLFDKIPETRSKHVEESFTKLLREIERYVMYHFETEEHLMRMYSFPGFSVHQSDHEQMGNKFVQFMDDYDQETLNPVSMKIFLAGWLMEHSRTSDSEYVKWISNIRKDVIHHV